MSEIRKKKYLNHFLASLLAIHEAFGNNVGSKQFISLAELLEGNSVGETLTADTDAFEDTVATQLVEHKRSVDLAGALLVVGNDTANEIGVGVAQCRHQLRQLFLVQLRHSPEHTYNITYHKQVNNETDGKLNLSK